jgi:hypothetical protein
MSETARFDGWKAQRGHRKGIQSSAVENQRNEHCRPNGEQETIGMGRRRRGRLGDDEAEQTMTVMVPTAREYMMSQPARWSDKDQRKIKGYSQGMETRSKETLIICEWRKEDKESSRLKETVSGREQLVVL